MSFGGNLLATSVQVHCKSNSLRCFSIGYHIMLRRISVVPLILTLQSTSHRVPSAALAFATARGIAAESFCRKSGISKATQSDTEDKMSANTQQLFGRFKISPEQIFHRSASSFAMVNLRPIVPGHVLICSSRVTPLLSDLDDEEYDDLWRSVRSVQKVLKQQYKCEAFNVAVQDGSGAGQSVPHVHVHVLPRYAGDLQRNDDIYDHLEEWAPREEMSAKKARLDVPEDSERNDRTVEKMAEEAGIYRSLMEKESS